MKKFKVKITWGVTSLGDDQTKTYEFDTEKELDAFLYGVDESNGWLEYANHRRKLHNVDR
jgi:hypothetical protein